VSRQKTLLLLSKLCRGFYDHHYQQQRQYLEACDEAEVDEEM
jgi:hypothetical protein